MLPNYFDYQFFQVLNLNKYFSFIYKTLEQYLCMIFIELMKKLSKIIIKVRGYTKCKVNKIIKLNNFKINVTP